MSDAENSAPTQIFSDPERERRFRLDQAAWRRRLATTRRSADHLGRRRDPDHERQTTTFRRSRHAPPYSLTTEQYLAEAARMRQSHWQHWEIDTALHPQAGNRP